MQYSGLYNLFNNRNLHQDLNSSLLKALGITDEGKFNFNCHYSFENSLIEEAEYSIMFFSINDERYEILRVSQEDRLELDDLNGESAKAYFQVMDKFIRITIIDEILPTLC